MKPNRREIIVGGITSDGNPLDENEWGKKQGLKKEERDNNCREIAQAQRGVGVEILPPCKKT